ncbi:serine protease gd-like isoform X3 [Phlebotomus argentipes]|uniref:serine protease gd-like isoform X3 n=1 Tax=Phlebotomus argentipes TaxID=94469 RepID=UPI0028935E52|nr:serine protease gd-like isoform X3 [Phlebotomus argentipes]
MNFLKLLPFFCVVLFTIAQRLDHPKCPNGVKYIYIGPKLGWQAIGWAWTTESSKVHNITMDVDFATVPLNDTTFIGSLKMLHFHRLRTPGNEERWNVIYEILFPIQDPLPHFTKIHLNGAELCDDHEKAHTDFQPDVVRLHMEYNDFLREQRFTAKLIKRPEPKPVPLNTMQDQQTSSENLGCGKVDLSNIYVPLVLEGTTIQRGTWPWLVSVYSYSKLRLGFRCGATLVSRKLVVTAAHCFFDIYKRRVKTEDVIVILGQYNLKRPHDTGSEIVYPDSVNIHPNYGKRNSIDSDIAVVVLTEAIRFTTYIRPACLWNETESKESIVGHKGFSAGWGRDENGNFFTELPKQIEIPVVSDEECLRSHEAFPKITSEVTFCAGWRNGSEGPCNGDSGGPLIFDREGRWTLRGVVSTSLSTDGSNTCNLNEYVVFTDVAKFRQWIISFSDEDYKF